MARPKRDPSLARTEEVSESVPVVSTPTPENPLTLPPREPTELELWLAKKVLRDDLIRSAVLGGIPPSDLHYVSREIEENVEARVGLALRGFDLDQLDRDAGIEHRDFQDEIYSLYIERRGNSGSKLNLFVELRPEKGVSSTVLSESLYETLAIELRRSGLRPRDAAKAARSVVDDFSATSNGAKVLVGHERQTAAANLAISALRALAGPALQFHSANSAAAPLFNDRDKSQFPTAESFLKSVYQGRLGMKGDLDQAMLRRLDAPLVAQLDVEFRGAAGRKRLRDLVPSFSDRTDEKLRAVLGYVPEGKERKTALSTLARGGMPKPRR